MESGFSGLTNLGNTCYLNSSLQILSHIDELNTYLKGVKKLNEIKDSTLTIEWILLYNLMWTKNCVISPNRYVNKIKMLSKEKENNTFCNFNQNDANEYFYFMLECIHNSLNLLDNIKLKKINDTTINNEIDKYESKDCSIIHYLFCSFLKYTYLNKDTNVVEFTKSEPHFMLEISIPLNDTTLEDCIRFTFQDETLDSLWYDDKTKTNKQLIKKTTLGYLPTILVIHLKRWTPSLNKNKHVVHFNEVLNMLEFSGQNEAYELFGIINHQGNMCGGHYFSYIKKNKWYIFDDTNIKTIPFSNVVSEKNYCLFYRKIK
uniref:USP domain-containing protein n=1 Tax=viral metagenome TaxID=1070528 RepID=A0A6C0EVE5_9ZZZZ